MINKAETPDNNSNSEEQITIEIKELDSSIENLEGNNQNEQKCSRKNGSCSTELTDSSILSQSSDSLEMPKECSLEEDDNDVDAIINSEILHNLRTKLTGFPADSFACTNCGELFLSKSGCTQHLSRKTIRIVHKCSNCGSCLEFFNRCTFLLHIKEHGIIPTNTYLKTTTKFEVLAESHYLNFEYGEVEDKLMKYCDQADGWISPQNDSNELDVNEERKNSPNNANKTEPITENAELSFVDPTSESPTISCNDMPCHNISQNCIPSSSPELRSEFSCYSCDRDFSDAKDFFTHLKEQETNGAAAKTVYNCNIDNIPSYSCCKYLLHNKVIHEKSCPFICPECGQCFDYWDHLYDHAKHKCFHLAQSLRYSCVLNTCCADDGTKLLYKNFGDLMQHFAKEHHKIVLQCLYCSRAFATWEWLFKHLLNDPHSITINDSVIHQLSSVLNPDSSSTLDPNVLAHRFSKSLIQCLICNVVFCSESLYHQHFSLKLNNHSEMRIVFTCEKCSQHFINSADLENHLKDSEICCTASVKSKSTELSSESECTEPTEKSDNSNTGNKTSKLSSRSYRPRPKPLRVQPARAAATTTIPNIPNPNYVLSSSINIRNGPSRQHIRQQCRHCRQSFDLSAIKKHENTCSKLQLDPGYCLTCKQNYQGSLLLWYHGKNHVRNGFQICLFCNNKEIQSEFGESNDKEFKDNNVLHDHFYNDHAANAKLPFKCLLCREVVSNKEGVFVHLKKHHDLATIDSFQVKRSRSFQISQLPRLPSKGKLQNELKPLQSNLKRESSSVTNEPYQDGHNKKHKKLHNEDEISSANGGVEGENDESVAECLDASEKIMVSVPMPCPSLVTKTQNARDQEGKFSCFKCEGFFANSEDEFCDHIRLNHVLSDQEEERHYNGGIGVFPVEFLDFWCPECDISFVVKPSLVKHLQFSHDYIEDVDEYMKKVGYDSKRPVKENQCEICYLRCSDSIDHYSHMKTHGLAFLRLRQQRKQSDK